MSGAFNNYGQEPPVECYGSLEEQLAEARREAAGLRGIIRSISVMLGWENVPPQATLERDIAALKARTRDAHRAEEENARLQALCKETSEKIGAVLELLGSLTPEGRP